MNKKLQRLARHAGRLMAILLVASLPGRARAEISARAAYEAGRSASSKDARIRLFDQGMSIARDRLKAQPDDAEGLYWLAVNMGAHALERGKLAALPVVPRMEALLLRLDQVSPAYEQAGAARVLGRLYHQAPAVISIGSDKQARKFLDRALRLAPAHPGNLAFAADYLVGNGDKAKARDYASRAVAALAGKQLNQEEREWNELARSVLKATR
jgi:hypothetical protein